ncbi:ABC transporter ATP-binding protein [Mesorhizobium sp. 113-3-3]|uniref:ABC transporter ATP-binding protein n=1 Tax=Mesorhizobium sp. 113-3-3 TaxID=2744516 RepID=UPI00192738FD|nr:ABC transporter ATP-binding protein [Mesorhizobium sp. 113-3-3]BCG82110.1 sugar ABC transporter ATP-binding protein [Mesorhizobium sp. 113-3-3]
MSSLALNQINKFYGPNLAVLKDINLEIDSGEFLVLLGPSGCGKSTLLHAIAGLHGVTSGEIKLNDRVINDLPCQHRDIAMVFQSYALYPSMTVRQNISFPLEMRKVSSEKRAEAVQGVAKLLQIEHLLDRKPSQLSGGQRQRVAIGRALVREPSIFLFDEPLSNLDALLRVEMRTELKKLHQRMGKTTVYVTHDQIEAMTLATRIAILDKGALQQVGTPNEVYDRPANTFVATFIGAPRINLIDGSVVKSGSSLTARFGDAPDRIPVPAALATPLSRAAPACTFGIRPENFSTVAGSPGENDVDIDVVIELIEPTGSDDVIIFKFAGAELTARLRAGSILGLGPTRLRLNTTKLVAFDRQTGSRIG